MAGLVPAIHVFLEAKAWMPGTIGERSDAVLRTAMAGHDGGEVDALGLCIEEGGLADASYRYKVGDIEVTVLTDGFRMVPVDDKYLRNASASDLAAALAAAGLPTDKMKNTYAPIVITTAGKRVLFDTGNGEAAAKQSNGERGTLNANLAAAPGFVGRQAGLCAVGRVQQFCGVRAASGLARLLRSGPAGGGRDAPARL
jgi:hypothetical protein